MWRRLSSVVFPLWCAGCGTGGVALCDACAQLGPPHVFVCGDVRVRAVAAYAGPLRDAIVAMKRGERAYLEALARFAAPLVPSGSVLVPVPTTRVRAAERGFDQGRELARRVALLREGSVADVLRKRGAAQRGLGRRARLAAHGRFVVRAGRSVPAHAVLIDDVVTTGATLRDAAAALRAAGTSVSGAVVVARTPWGRNPGASR